MYHLVIVYHYCVCLISVLYLSQMFCVFGCDGYFSVLTWFDHAQTFG